MPTVIYQGASWTYEEILSPLDGYIWMDRNLGATQAATSSSDADSYGHLFQWGRGDDGSQLRNSGTTGTQYTDDAAGNLFVLYSAAPPYDWRNPQNDGLWNNGLNIPIPTGWRLPTLPDLEVQWQNWSTANAAGAFASELKLPAAGYRDGFTGDLTAVGVYGTYWTSTVGEATPPFSTYLGFSPAEAGMLENGRVAGMAVRLLREPSAKVGVYPFPSFYPTY